MCGEKYFKTPDNPFNNTWVFLEQPSISGICDVRNNKGDMAQRAESNSTDKLPWTSPGSFGRKKGINRQIIPNCYQKHTIFISFIYIVSSLFFPTFSQKSTTTCWCKKTGQQFLVTCTRRQAPTVHKDSPKSCKWAAKSMGSACPSLGTDTGFGLLSPRDFLTSSAFFRQHYKELQMGIEKKSTLPTESTLPTTWNFLPPSHHPWGCSMQCQLSCWFLWTLSNRKWKVLLSSVQKP